MIPSLQPLLDIFQVAPGRLTWLDAAQLPAAHMPPFPPDAPALITGDDLGAHAGEIQQALETVYPADHAVKLAGALGTPDQWVDTLPLGSLSRYARIAAATALYLSPLGPETAFEAFQEIIAHLRAPDGCPWDREQTHQTLRSNLIEEAYEVLAALDAADPAKMAEEFGDLLLQIVLHAQIAREAGEFGMADILAGIYTKIVRRHPHVFGEEQVEGVGHVLQNWERIKAEERRAQGNADASLLDSVPVALPALLQAAEYQKRAARVGFDWPTVEGVYAKIAEEAEELRMAGSAAERSAELGDLLFAVANLARWLEVDAETALRETNARFKRRFTHIEKTARLQGRKPGDLSPQEMDALWEEAKQQED